MSLDDIKLERGELLAMIAEGRFEPTTIIYSRASRLVRMYLRRLDLIRSEYYFRSHIVLTFGLPSGKFIHVKTKVPEITKELCVTTFLCRFAEEQIQRIKG